MAIKISCGKDSKNFGDYEKKIIDRLAKEYYGKIEKHFKDINDFEVYAKCFLKEGKVKRYQIDARAVVPNFNFEASADEYSLADAVHIALEKIMSEIEHKTHLSNQGNKFRKLQNIRKRK